MGVRQPAVPASVLVSLRDTVGSAHVLTDPDVTAGYAIDWTRRFRGTAAAVVRPATTAEVAAVVRLCGDAGIAVVPQGVTPAWSGEACRSTTSWS